MHIDSALNLTLLKITIADLDQLTPGTVKSSRVKNYVEWELVRPNW